MNEQVLQAILAEMIHTQLTAKHLHWVIVGRTFQPVHELLDRIVAMLVEHVDTLAERMMALAVVPAPVRVRVEVPTGTVDIETAIWITLDLLGKVSEMIDGAYETDLDLATEDVLIGAQRDIDKYAWFLQAHS